MTEKERLYQMAKAVAVLTEAKYLTNTGNHVFDTSEDLMFEAHCRVIDALGLATEALEKFYYEGE